MQCWMKPSAANAVYQISDGVIVDIGGGTTGLAILKDGKVVDIQDEPTGGTHLSLVLAGNYHISFDEAEVIKQDYSKHREILPILKPVVEKMASIIKKYVNLSETDTIYLCGGTCCLTGMEKIIEKETVSKPSSRRIHFGYSDGNCNELQIVRRNTHGFRCISQRNLSSSTRACCRL